ncbi:MAG: SDR family NAD(P)-dependent oxidoreductase [Thermaurantiacus sp.]
MGDPLMDGRLDGRVCWVTGASSGIGRALADVLAEHGARLILSGRRADALADVAAGKEALVLPFEATDHARLPAVVEEAISWAGHVDLLVNNAGISQRSPAEVTAFDVYRRLMDVDVLGPIHLTQLLLPHMLARGQGHLAVTASIAGKVGAPLRTGYCAAKHAVIGYFDALRAELEGRGLKVSVIVPGFVATDIARNALKGDGAAADREDSQIAGGYPAGDAARVIAAGLAAGEREIMVGAEGSLEMGLPALKAANAEAFFDAMASMGAAEIASYREKWG